MSAYEIAPARSVEAEAAAWIAQQERTDWTNEDRTTLDAWLSQSLAHRVAYWRLNAAWNRTERLAALRTPEASARETPARMAHFWSRVVAVAIIVSALAAGAAFLFARPHAQTFATALGEHKTIKLPDGSQIELNTNSTIRLATDAHVRTVWLDRGEAYFEIRHDVGRAFTVISANRSVTDLGTKFSVRRDAMALRVAVIEGRVLFDMAEPTRSPTLLSQGDVAVATTDSLSLAVTKNTARQLSDNMAWRRGLLVFDRVTLGDAAAEFNRYNRKKLVIVDRKVAQRTIGATFPIHAVEQFVDVTQDVLGLHVEKHGDEIVISR